jgi:hypothetical protein
MATLFNIGELSMENLLMLQSTVSAAIAIRSRAALVVAAKEPKAPAADKPKEPKAPAADKPKEPKAKEPKENKAPRAPGVAAAWLSHIVKARPEAYELYKASSEKKQGVALLFAKEYRAKNADEYAAFELSFKEAHPSPPKAAPKVPEVSAEYAALTASLKGVFEAPASPKVPAPAAPSPNPFDEEVVEVQPAEAAEAKKVRKPRGPMTDEKKAQMAAKKAATLAKKAAEANAPAAAPAEAPAE